MVRFNLRSIVVILGVAASSLAAAAQVAPPERIHYQGVLRDAAGDPLNTSVDMVLSLYDDPSAGTLLWAEIHSGGNQVTVSGGLFSVALGDPALKSGGTAAGLGEVFAGGGDIYLGVTVGADGEMTPRVKVQASAYALNAGSLQGVVNVNGAGSVGIGTETPEKMVQIGDDARINTEGMIRLVSRSGTGGANRTWDVGVPETDQDTAGKGYSFVVDDTQVGTDPEFMVKWGSGNVGIGTIIPSYKLDVAGDIRITGALRDTAGDAGSSGQILKSTGSAIDWVDAASTDDGDWTVSGSDMYSAVSGNVGIGTAGPANKLSVSGDADFTGSVGIGTTAPQGKLHVAGPLFVDGFLEGILDQEQASHNVSVGHAAIWQSFTAGMTGDLMRIEVRLRCPDSTEDSVESILKIFAGQGWDGALLATQSVTLSGSDYTLHSLTLATPVPVISGNIYTFQLISTAYDNAFIRADFTNPYPGGRSYLEADQDLMFRTYMASGSMGRVFHVGNTGSVGIGTSNPGFRLDVAGDARLTGALRSAAGNAGTSGQVLESTGTGIGWVDLPNPDDGDWTISGNDIYSTVSGNVGVGVASPSNKLDVRGAESDTPGEGLVRIQSDTSNAAFQWRVGAAGSKDLFLDSYYGGWLTPLSINRETGGVGIGTTGAGAKLTVKDSLAVQTLMDETLILDRSDAGRDWTQGGSGPWQSWTCPIPDAYWAIVTIECRSPVAGSTGNATLNIFDGEGLGGTLLSTQSIAIPDAWNWYSFTILDPPAMDMLAQYTLQVVPDSRDQTFMGMDGGDPYSGGQYGGYPTDDLRFRIYASMSSGVGFRVNENGSVGIRSEDTLGYTLAVNGSAAKTGGGSWSSFSDGRLKDLSGEYALGLEEVLALRPYTYRYKDKNPLNILEKGSFIGPVAQEVRGVIPQAVETAGNGYLLVNNEPIFWAMVNAFKELDSRTRETLPGEEQAVPAADSAGEDMGFASEKDASVHTAGASADSHGAVGPYGPTVQLLPSIETVTPGDVLVMIPENGDELYPCALAADPAVVGIAGEGTVLSEEGAVREIPVVLGGITLCKADAAYGSIRRGDLLVASPTPGHAMKMQAFAPGTVVAKALESLETGTGTIRVLVMLR